MKQKSFFIIFKGLLIEQIAQFFLEGERPTLKRLYSETRRDDTKLNQVTCFNFAEML